MELTKEQYEAIKELIRIEDSIKYALSKPKIEEALIAVKSGNYKIV